MDQSEAILSAIFENISTDLIVLEDLCKYSPYEISIRLTPQRDTTLRAHSYLTKNKQEILDDIQTTILTVSDHVGDSMTHEVLTWCVMVIYLQHEIPEKYLWPYVIPDEYLYVHLIITHYDFLDTMSWFS